MDAISVVDYNGRNEEHRYYSFTVAASTPEEADRRFAEIAAWCEENFPPAPQTGKARPRSRFTGFQGQFLVWSKTDATAFRLRWC
jgi:hypothetical protein